MSGSEEDSAAEVLEGPGEAVVETFENIRRDPRHGAIVKLAQYPVETRAFANWSMGYEAGGAAMAEVPSRPPSPC